MSDDLRSIAQKAETLLLELRELLQVGPHIQIVHRFCTLGTECQGGEEVWAGFLVHRGRSYQLQLSLSMRLLLDYMARHRHCAQSARQIEAGIRGTEFFQKHGMNATRPNNMLRRISRSAVKTYIVRLRHAFAIAAREARIRLDPERVFISQKTVSNEIGYKLRANVEWVHVGFLGV